MSERKTISPHMQLSASSMMTNGEFVEIPIPCLSLDNLSVIDSVAVRRAIDEHIQSNPSEFVTLRAVVVPVSDTKDRS